jgi:hypothetical protein
MGSDCSWNCWELLPALAVPITTTAPVIPAVVGWMVARPLISDNTVACVDDKITGIGWWEEVLWPIQRMGSLLGMRPTNDWKTTLAPRTGFGKVEESVTRMVKGRKFSPTNIS